MGVHPQSLADYLSAPFALFDFGFFNVIVTFTFSTAWLLSTAFAKSFKAFVMLSISYPPLFTQVSFNLVIILYTFSSTLSSIFCIFFEIFLKLFFILLNILDNINFLVYNININNYGGHNVCK